MASHTNAEVQQALKDLGYDPGEIDGAFGPKSSAALAKFQEDKKLTVNGIPDDKTLKALFPSKANVGPRTIQATIADYALTSSRARRSTPLAL